MACLAKNAVAIEGKVWRQTVPPVNDGVDETTFDQFPATGYMSFDGGGLAASSASFEKCSFIWVNGAEPRVNASPGNPVNGSTIRVKYTTEAKANAATRIRGLYQLGASLPTLQAIADGAGIPLTTSIAAYEALVSGGFVTDAVFHGISAGPIDRICYDFEPHDERSPASADEFAATLQADAEAAGKPMVYYGNEFLDGAAEKNGTSRALLARFYRIYLLPFPDGETDRLTTSLKRLLDYVGAPLHHKCGISVPLSNISVSTARAIRTAIRNSTMAEDINIWLNGATLCTDETNAKLVALCGGFERPRAAAALL